MVFLHHPVEYALYSTGKKVTMDLRNLNDQIYHFSPPEAS